MIRLGIIGTGRIARRFIPEAETIKGIKVSCIYNPHINSAERLAAEFSIPFYTDDLEELERRADAVYIASPHETHYTYARYFLNKKKHVLCEKPLCFAKEQAVELYRMAEQRNCIMMEAVKTSFCPGFLKLTEVAGSGKIGEIRDIEACFSRLTSMEQRELTDRRYGGSFTEFGSYTLLPIIKLLGTEYKRLTVHSINHKNGVDGYTRMFLEYDRGMAVSKTGLTVKSEGQLIVAGTKGYILAASPWWQTRYFEVRFEDPERKEIYTFPYEGQGLRYEIDAFLQKVSGNEEKRGVGSEESIAMAGIMEKFLKAAGR